MNSYIYIYTADIIIDFPTHKVLVEICQPDHRWHHCICISGTYMHVTVRSQTYTHTHNKQPENLKYAIWKLRMGEEHRRHLGPWVKVQDCSRFLNLLWRICPFCEIANGMRFGSRVEVPLNILYIFSYLMMMMMMMDVLTVFPTIRRAGDWNDASFLVLNST